VAPPSAVLAAPNQLDLAVTALLSGKVATARQHLLEIHRRAMWTYWFEAGNEYGRRHQPVAHETGIKTAAPPSKVVMREVFERDRWRCQYCGLHVVDPRVLRIVSQLLPAVFPWTYRNADSHPAGIVLAATLDHIDARAGGGDSSQANLVTSCGVCQYSKGSCSLDELGLADPRGTAPIVDGWNGLSSLVPALTALPHPPDGDHRPVEVDFELEYLITYGRVANQLPAVKHPPLVERLVRLYESALPEDRRYDHRPTGTS
jgi:5-methylcytosine-specific restriction endonuclease McrA